MSALPGEDDLIAAYFAPLAGSAGLGLADDAALLSTPRGCDLVATTDALVAGVHFFANDPPAQVAKKALRVNMSDLAAKGAKPIGFLLNLALPPAFPASDLGEFARGLGEDASLFACPLIGGDTVRTPGPLTIAVTALGAVPKGRMVRRTGVRPGDSLYVTGEIGDAALGLKLRLDSGGQYDWLSSRARAHLLARYLTPLPRTALRECLLRRAHAAMDVSDGFIGDLTKMLRVSGASAHIELARAPLSAAAREMIGRAPELFDSALTGGDDYELLVAVPADNCSAFEKGARAAGVRTTCVGQAIEGRAPPRFEDAAGHSRQFATVSFSHF